MDSKTRKLFEQVGATQVSNNVKNYYGSCRGVALVVEDIYLNPDEGHKISEPTFITKHLIVESTPIPPPREGFAPANAKDELVTYIQKPTTNPKRLEMFKKNMKRYVQALLGESVVSTLDGTQFAEAFQEAVGPQKLTRGFLVGFQAKFAKEGKEPHIYPEFFAVSKALNTPELVAKRRAELDQSHPVQTVKMQE